MYFEVKTKLFYNSYLQNTKLYTKRCSKNKRCVDTSALSHTRSVNATKAKNYTEGFSVLKPYNVVHNTQITPVILERVQGVNNIEQSGSEMKLIIKVHKEVLTVIFN